MEPHMLAVDVTLGDTFSSGAPQPLFDVPWYSGGVARWAYDLTADAQRFLFVREDHPPAVAEVDRGTGAMIAPSPDREAGLESVTTRTSVGVTRKPRRPRLPVR